MRREPNKAQRTAGRTDLLAAHARGDLLAHVASRPEDQYMLQALWENKELLQLVRISAKADGPHSISLRRALFIIDST